MTAVSSGVDARKLIKVGGEDGCIPSETWTLPCLAGHGIASAGRAVCLAGASPPRGSGLLVGLPRAQLPASPGRGEVLAYHPGAAGWWFASSSARGYLAGILIAPGYGSQMKGHTLWLPCSRAHRPGLRVQK